MKGAFLLVLCIGLALAVDSDVLFRWNEFKTTYGRSYKTEEEAQRLAVFEDNIRLIEEMNSHDPFAYYGINQFADLSPKEFKQLYLMNVTLDKPASSLGYIQHVDAVPSDFDWKSKGVVTPVKDQGQCGSCWDFSATETIESVCALAGYPLTTLSEQQVLDCDKADYGCNGGWPYNAYQYVVNAGGIETESAYPYSASDGTCKFNAKFIECKVSKWQYAISNKDETAMQNFLYTNSPLSVCVDAETWQFYTGGVITSKSNCGKSIDHCVQVTGWSQMQGMTVWNVRNSWGVGWGVSGYLYVQQGADVCAIAEVVTVPCVVSKTTGKLVC